MLLFQAKNLSLGYGSHKVLEGVNLEIFAGEFWFLLGPNGQGKSTFLHSLLGTLQPIDGEIARDSQATAMEKVGFIPQRAQVNATVPTTIREFVLLGLVGLHCSEREKSERLQWAVERVGLDEHVKRSFWDLSEGQRQRTLVARALARKPEILFADEPTNGLDLPTESDLLHCLARLNREDGLTILFVTHDLHLALRFSTHVALFQKGMVVAGTRQEIFTPEHLRSTFGLSLEIPVDLK